jgi:peptidoglycan/LPS O-acetylase OafA/YrhL
MPQEPRLTNGDRGARFAYIDALRGYAILGVIGVHASQLFPSLQWPLRLIAGQGARGVQLFFTVSALTLMMSWQSRADGVLPFWTRRVFRIGPMFWLALAYYLALVGWLHVGLRYWGPTEISWRSALASAALMHGFHPDTIDSIVPGGWSIADEMEFYALFPLLVLIIRSWRAAAVALIASTAVVVALSASMTRILPAPLGAPSPSFLANFGELFPFQLPAFLVGILVFYLLRTFSGRLSCNVLRTALLCALAFIAAFPFLAAFFAGRIHWSIYFLLFGLPPISYSMVFGVVAFCLAEGAGRFLVNAVVSHIGKVSYSAYFWHFAVLELIGMAVASFGWSLARLGWPAYLTTFALAVMLSVAGATLTFLVIEQPMIRIGHGLAKASAKRRASMATNRPAIVSPAGELMP